MQYTPKISDLVTAAIFANTIVEKCSYVPEIECESPKGQ